MSHMIISIHIMYIDIVKKIVEWVRFMHW